ncbi:TIGR02391 family protein [Candidatus Pacebacteria bacterium]|nr:TIGR02391 family protein [Candidatus Paceibacterota bacterium]
MKKKAIKKVEKKRVPKKRLRRLGAFEIQKLGVLAEQLGNLIPANSPSKNALSFKKIARDLGWNKYYKEGANKKETILGLLKKIHIAHPILFRRIIIENIPAAISRRHKNGNPVLKQEIEEMNTTLLELNHNITEELFSLDFPEDRPAIVPPTPEMQRALDKMSLNPVLLPECGKLFKDGHLNDAVRKALEKFEKFIQTHSGLTTIGVNLMDKAFDRDNTLISISSETNEGRRKGLQEGFQRLAMGAMGYWRNYCSHNDEKQMPPQDAFAIIATISHMIYKVQEELESN